MLEKWLLEVDSVSKRFPGVQALSNVQFRLRPGSVHALCGGNGAGKSTFVSILMGFTHRDTGSIKLRGQEVRFSSPRQAMRAGMSVIQQELSSVLDMTVAENIYLGREPRRGPFIDFRAMNADAAAVLGRLNFPIQPTAKLRDLSLAERQLVEIAKALSHKADVIIMDEPTSAIGEAEAERLFETIRLLTAEGKGVIYVSHRLSEIFQIADSYTVFRDGGFVETGAIKDIDRRHLIRLILGGELKDEFVKENTPGTTRMLEVGGLTRTGHFQDVSLAVHAGEILGIFGLMGSGRSEFFECLFGIAPADRGEIRVKGERVSIASPSAAMALGMALVTEDRKESGLVLSSSVNDNISIASLKQITRLGFVPRRREAQNVRRMVDYFSIRTPSLRQLVRNLSGGNQQKVVLGRWLLTNPDILLLDEPTRGIDVGSKREMYRFMSNFAREGKAVVMVSSELPEVLGMADRIVVFRDGHMAGTLTRDQATQESVMHLAA